MQIAVEGFAASASRAAARRHLHRNGKSRFLIALACHPLTKGRRIRFPGICPHSSRLRVVAQLQRVKPWRSRTTAFRVNRSKAFGGVARASLSRAAAEAQ